MQSSRREIPEAIEPIFPELAPNRPLDLYTGLFEIRLSDKSIILKGDITYRWIPKNQVVFNGELMSKGFDSFPVLGSQAELVINGDVTGSVMITYIGIGSTPLLSGYLISDILLGGDRSITAHHFLFAIPNMTNISGKEFFQKRKNGDDSFKRGRISLTTKDFCVDIDPSDSITTDQKYIRHEGGYAVTHWGRLSFSKPIGFKQMKDVVFPLSMFLSFVTGRRLHVQYIRAIHDNKELWTDYTPYRTTAYKPVTPWYSPPFDDHYQDAWSKFYELWTNDENDRDSLTTLVYWYLLVNTNAGEGEGSLIMAQAALELIYNWMLLERDGLIMGKDSESINASNKMRLVLNRLGVSYEIPTPLTSLLGFCKTDKDLCDGPAAIVRIRNTIVHSSKTKRDLARKMDKEALFDALKLSTWYIELSLLHILDFNGQYLNRCLDKVIYVPWAKDIT